MSSTFVFLHLYGGSARTWGEVIARLPEARGVAFDLRGFGDQGDTPQKWGVDESADDIAARLEGLNIERFTLVGHSMGGKIALALAARALPGMERLMLFAPSPPSPEPMSDETRAQLAAGFGQQEAAEKTVANICAHPLPEALRELAVEDILRSKPNAWRAWLDMGSREDISARMEAIRVPVDVVAGEFDSPMTPDLLKREVVGRLAQARFHVVPNAAHLIPLEAPDFVAELLRADW